LDCHERSTSISACLKLCWPKVFRSSFTRTPPQYSALISGQLLPSLKTFYCGPRSRSRNKQAFLKFEIKKSKRTRLPLAQILSERGAIHERNYIAHLTKGGSEIVRIEGTDVTREPVAETLAAMRHGIPVIVQGALSHDGWNGVADVLLSIEPKGEKPCGLTPSKPAEPLTFLRYRNWRKKALVAFSRSLLSTNFLLFEDVQQRPLIGLGRGYPAPACRRETKLGGDPNHDFGLAIGDSDIG